MTKTISFNTGRRYTSEGQLVVATLHDDGVVTFMDHSRLVSGEFALAPYVVFDQATVMSYYDDLAYEEGPRSWRDGMSREGCNRRQEGR